MGTAIRYMRVKSRDQDAAEGCELLGEKPMRYTVNVKVEMVKRVSWLKNDDTRYYGIPT